MKNASNVVIANSVTAAVVVAELVVGIAIDIDVFLSPNSVTAAVVVAELVVSIAIFLSP